MNIGAYRGRVVDTRCVSGPRGRDRSRPYPCLP